MPPVGDIYWVQRMAAPRESLAELSSFSAALFKPACVQSETLYFCRLI
jgi:hypothetical protein